MHPFVIAPLFGPVHGGYNISMQPTLYSELLSPVSRSIVQADAGRAADAGVIAVTRDYILTIAHKL